MGATASGASSAERVRLSRWVNKVEAKADELLELLDHAPDPLPRHPVLDPRLLDLLGDFTLEQDDPSEAEYPRVRFLKPGNGHQRENKARALACLLRVLDGSEYVDHRTIRHPKWGKCHVAAYTHPKGAMVSSTRNKDPRFGSVDWHNRDHVILFRDVGDGRCIVYIGRIEPLFERRTIGHHGVHWADVDKIASERFVISSSDALAAEKNDIQ